MSAKYVFVTGGVVSGLGKGITVASLGRLLKARGCNVITQKFDPYINIDPGNLNPLEHGEVFVTDDGAETDLDLGHYERFTDTSLTENSSMTVGKVYRSVLQKERKGEYKGATVQVIPHITNEIKDRVRQAAGDGDIVITEVGGTVGDIESLPILEAIRQIPHDVGRDNVAFIHVSLVPHLDYIGEMKTKPTQHSVKQLQSLGIQPDMIVCRSDRHIPIEMREKLALFCNVEPRCVIQNNHAESIYEVPLLLEEEKFAETLCDKLQMEPRKPDLTEWRSLVEKQKNLKKQINIALVGQYASLWDSYLSVSEALSHAGIHQDVKVEVEWIPADDIADGGTDKLKNFDGIVLAGSIGEEITPGKLQAVEYAKSNKLPFFGIGNGWQVATNVSDYSEACGSRSISLNGGKAQTAYGDDSIKERFRGICANADPVFEIDSHPWFVCVQFHPEYKSRLTKASPLFISFVSEVAFTKTSKVEF